MQSEARCDGAGLRSKKTHARGQCDGGHEVLMLNYRRRECIFWTASLLPVHRLIGSKQADEAGGSQGVTRNADIRLQVHGLR